MKKALILILFVLMFTAAAVQAGDLDTVKAAGVLAFGVSPDKAPFVFYDSSDELTGIDIKLMEEIANRMNVKLDVVEMSSDDLIESLTIEQVDVIGGAFSKTNSRMENIDFTRVYYIADPVFISRQNSLMTAANGPESFSGKKIGVLKNSGFEEWIKTELVEKEYAQKRDIYTYDKLDDAIRALDRERVDLVLMDYSLYQSRYMQNSDYKYFNYGSAKDSYAFGLRKNSNLRAEINKHLADMLKDGTAQKIADTFFNEDYADAAVIQWNSKKTAATATPAAPTVPAATPTANPALASCSYAMAYVTDLSIPDGQPISAGAGFTKSWRIKNTGSCAWTTDFYFGFVSGSQMSGANWYMPTAVYPGNTVDISIPMVAPSAAGTYQGNWQLMTPQGKGIGYQLWVQIVVQGAYSTPDTSSSSSSSSSSTSPTAVVFPTIYIPRISGEAEALATIAAMQPTATPEIVWHEIYIPTATDLPLLSIVDIEKVTDYGKIFEQIQLATPIAEIEIGELKQYRQLK